MRIIEVSEKSRYRGRYNIYEEGDADCPPFRKDYEDAAVGDWIKSSDNLVCQVIGLQLTANSRMIFTPYGIDTVYVNGRRRVLELDRPRPSFWRLTESVKAAKMNKYGAKHLSMRAQMFLMALLDEGPENAVDLYCKIFSERDIQTHANKYSTRKRIKAIIEHPDAEKIMAQSIQKVLEAEGETGESWVRRLIHSRGDKIETEVQRKLHMTLGLLLPDVRKELLSKDIEQDPPNMFPLPQQQTEDAVFEDVPETKLKLKA